MNELQMVVYITLSSQPANEAFKNAQALEPSYTAAWVGQVRVIY